MVFRDRAEAAALLAERLAALRGSRPLILAVPRGAVPMGRAIADALEGDLDVVLVRKVGAPGHPEYAVGTVDETGHLHVERSAERLGVPHDYLEKAGAEAAQALRAERGRLGRRMADPAGRTVVVVDDGVATGATLIGALHCLRDQAPAQLVAAVPVIAPSAVARVAAEVDELVYLEAPEPFYAVSQFYTDFPPVSEAEEVRALQHPEVRP